MSWLEAVAVFAAGVGAGTINAVVGSGTLITFPTLLAFGYPPVVANISNNIGLVPGGVSGTWGYRRELAGQGRRVLALVPMSLVGSVGGALLLLVLPAEAFVAVVPVLLAVSIVLVVIQPRLQSALKRRRALREQEAESPRHRLVVQSGVLGAGIYGGYFGAAQGVLLVGLLGSMLPESLQRVNALKNLLSLAVNSVAAVVFAVVAFDRIDWLVVPLIAAGSLLGGLMGAHVGRRLPAPVLRAVIVVVGITAIAKIVTS